MEDIAVFTLPIPPYPRHPFEETLGTTSKENEGTRLILEQPHARSAESEVGRQVISKITMSATRHSPNDIATFPLLVPQSNPGLPPALVSPASPNNGERRAAQVVDKENEMSMKSSPEVKHEGIPFVKILNGRQELLIEAAEEFKCSDEHSSRCQGLTPPVLASPESPDVADAKRTNQEVVSAAILLHSPESSAALMPPTLADPLPAYALPRSSLGLESWLRWKPPDHGESPRRHAYHAVNVRIWPNAIKRSPPPGAAFALSVSRPSLAYITQAIPSRHQSPQLGWRARIPPAGVETVRRCAVSIVDYNINASAEKHSPMSTVCFTPPKRQRVSTWADSPRLLSVELIWRACSKPPNATGESQQQSATIISAKSKTSVERSPLCQVAIVLLLCPLAPSVRVINPCRPSNEHIWRARKPPNEAEPWLLDEVVNKSMEGGIRGHSPVPRPKLALHATR